MALSLLSRIKSKSISMSHQAWHGPFSPVILAHALPNFVFLWSSWSPQGLTSNVGSWEAFPEPSSAPTLLPSDRSSSHHPVFGFLHRTGHTLPFEINCGLPVGTCVCVLCVPCPQLFILHLVPQRFIKTCRVSEGSILKGKYFMR